jgi:hypothetical protein
MAILYRGLPYPVIEWTEGDKCCSARWYSENVALPPKRVQVVDDRLPADIAYRLACEGTALLWRGDFQNARHLLKAITRRADRKSAKPGTTMSETFHLYRQAQSRKARVLGMLLIPLSADYSIPLRRAPMSDKLVWRYGRRVKNLSSRWWTSRVIVLTNGTRKA